MIKSKRFKTEFIVCVSCNQNKPASNFRKFGNMSRILSCKDCTAHCQKTMPYPILKQPSREFILLQLQRIKSKKL